MVEFKKRLRELMDIKKIDQATIVKDTGIPKSSLSMYLSGTRTPKQDTILAISNKYNVNLAWLHGYEDAPFENKIKFNLTSEAEEHLMLIALYEELNDVNREKVISYMKYVLHEQKGNN